MELSELKAGERGDYEYNVMPSGKVPDARPLTTKRPFGGFDPAR